MCVSAMITATKAESLIAKPNKLLAIADYLDESRIIEADSKSQSAIN